MFAPGHQACLSASKTVHKGRFPRLFEQLRDLSGARALASLGSVPVYSLAYFLLFARSLGFSSFSENWAIAGVTRTIVGATFYKYA